LCDIDNICSTSVQSICVGIFIILVLQPYFAIWNLHIVVRFVAPYLCFILIFYSRHPRRPRPRRRSTPQSQRSLPPPLRRSTTNRPTHRARRARWIASTPGLWWTAPWSRPSPGDAGASDRSYSKETSSKYSESPKSSEGGLGGRLRLPSARRGHPLPLLPLPMVV
jgi:hypothetical protein